jgi:NAD-dependent deacetylase
MAVDPQLLQALRAARHVAVLTGAGVSAESGVPTFRDKLTGLWERFDPAELATPQAFQRDPALVWGWYEWRRRLVERAQPNAAHRALAEWQQRLPRFTLITQNVDDLHERAGSRNVQHLHGQLARSVCESCRREADVNASENIPEGGCRIEPPRCSSCGARIRPGVVWFGEGLPQTEWRAALEAAEGCDLFLSVGTSALVQPAASLIERAAAAGAITVQVNANPTPLDDKVDFALRGPAGALLPQLLQRVHAEP